MPIYDYFCLDCEEKFSAFLRMNEEQKECVTCSSDSIIKIVSTIGDKIDKDKFKAKTGDLVKSHIEDARNAVKEEKQKLKGKVYKDD